MLKYPDYDSPFRVVIQGMANSVSQKLDDTVYKALQKVAVDVDKDKLLDILHQDAERYREAYRRGYETSKAEQITCDECKYFKEFNGEFRGFCMNYRWIHQKDWYCKDAERKEEEDDEDEWNI